MNSRSCRIRVSVVVRRNRRSPLVLRFPLRAALLLLGLAALPAVPASPALAQLPDKFTNLKVLPKDIAKDDLLTTMRGFSSALGVGCGYCHARSADGPRAEMDWASDCMSEKETARVMLRMTRMINTEQLPKVTTKHPDKVGVQCSTCHHGQARPYQVEDVLAEAYRQGGMDSLTTRYERLRKEYYGSAVYNFSASMLPELGERLAAGKDNAVLVALAEFNARQFPESGSAHFSLGHAYAVAGREDDAKKELARAVELDPSLKPNVEWQLQQMGKGKAR